MNGNKFSSPTIMPQLQPADRKRPRTDDSTDCPYLDSIVRHNLDFDFEKVCSISLSNLNVYACLVCGKYFQGRGKSSHAYFHSMDADHHVFMHLQTLKAYCLPDGYEINHPSLADIQVKMLDASSSAASYDLNGKKYTPGFIGLNNIKQNDYMNVVIQALGQVKPIRNFFLLQDLENSSQLVQRFGLLLRKMWSSRLFKGHVSPHEFLQEITNASNKRFRIDQQGDPMQFLTWLLNTIHHDLLGRSKKTTVIQRTFQGELQVNSCDNTVISPFFFLTLDLPPASLFIGDSDQAAIPQIAIEELLKKYDGTTETISSNQSHTYMITKLPQYLILCIKRFGKNEWALEKNPTITNFSPKNLIVTGANESKVYALVANISHEGKPGPANGVFKVQICDKRSQQWYSIQDLMIDEVLPQMIPLTETYIQVWESRTY